MERKKFYLLLLVIVAVFPLGLMGLGLYCCSYERGFSLSKISSKLSYNEMWETPPLSYEEKERLVNQVLSQTFHYYGSGSHTYAFISEDGKYVIKFFKMHKILPKNWLRDFPFSLFEKYRLENVEKRQDVFEAIFKSLKDAYERLRPESGLIYAHLNKTRGLKKKAVSINFNGNRYDIDLDSKEFVVQWKAEKLTDYLLKLKEAEDEERAQFFRGHRQTLPAWIRRSKCECLQQFRFCERTSDLSGLQPSVCRHVFKISSAFPGRDCESG
jgi:hypothetical protein